jgi:hypothetical protein
MQAQILPSNRKEVEPSERLPVWAKPLPRETLEQYADRLALRIHLDSLERSTRGDTAAHAKWREQALKGLGLGQKQEIDIKASRDDAWLQSLTDEELSQLDTLKQTAIARTSSSVPPSLEVSNNRQANIIGVMSTTDEARTSGNALVTEQIGGSE